MGDDEVSNEFREKLQQDLEGIQSALVTILESYNECLKYYSATLQKSIEGDSYQSQNDLIKLHQNTKNEARNQVLLSHFVHFFPFNFLHSFHSQPFSLTV